MKDCPCKGQWGKTWHQARGLPMCEHVQELRRSENQKRRKLQRPNYNPIPRNARIPWIPGTTIFVPEHEDP